MDKVLFIVPPSVEFDDFANPPDNVRVAHKKDGGYGSVLTDMPLGVLALSAYIKKSIKTETKLIDFYALIKKLERRNND